MTYQKVTILETKPYQIVFELEDGQIVKMPKIYFWEKVKAGLYEVLNQDGVEEFDAISSSPRATLFEGKPVQDASALIASEDNEALAAPVQQEAQEKNEERPSEYGMTEKIQERPLPVKKDSELFKSIQSKMIDKVLDKKKLGE